MAERGLIQHVAPAGPMTAIRVPAKVPPMPNVSSGQSAHAHTANPASASDNGLRARHDFGVQLDDPVQRRITPNPRMSDYHDDSLTGDGQRVRA